MLLLESSRDSLSLRSSRTATMSINNNIMNSIMNGETQHQDEPRDIDVACGRGKHRWNSAGNIRYKKLISTNIGRYTDGKNKARKTEIIREIYQTLVHENARFLKKEKESGIWVELSPKHARTKIAHALRDIHKTPSSSANASDVSDDCDDRVSLDKSMGHGYAPMAKKKRAFPDAKLKKASSLPFHMSSSSDMPPPLPTTHMHASRSNPFSSMGQAPFFGTFSQMPHNQIPASEVMLYHQQQLAARRVTNMQHQHQHQHQHQQSVESGRAMGLANPNDMMIGLNPSNLAVWPPNMGDHQALHSSISNHRVAAGSNLHALRQENNNIALNMDGRHGWARSSIHSISSIDLDMITQPEEASFDILYQQNQGVPSHLEQQGGDGSYFKRNQETTGKPSSRHTSSSSAALPDQSLSRGGSLSSFRDTTLHHRRTTTTEQRNNFQQCDPLEAWVESALQDQDGTDAQATTNLTMRKQHWNREFQAISTASISQRNQEHVDDAGNVYFQPNPFPF